MSECCQACKKPVPKNSQPGDFWSLTNYFGISAFLCDDCFDDVAHDSYGKPKNPKRLMLFKLKHAELV